MLSLPFQTGIGLETTGVRDLGATGLVNECQDILNRLIGQALREQDISRIRAIRDTLNALDNAESPYQPPEYRVQSMRGKLEGSFVRPELLGIEE